jgi:hypothetical protein
MMTEDDNTETLRIWQRIEWDDEWMTAKKSNPFRRHRQRRVYQVVAVVTASSETASNE